MSGGVYFLAERPAELRIEPYVTRHLSRHMVTLGEALPERPQDYKLIVLWNLRRIIRNLPATGNVIVFHSSDLPHGRGWAPIYYALAERHREHVISAILAAPEVDAGDVIAKARFRIQPCHTAASLRIIDEEVCVMLAAAILQRFQDRPITGAHQVGEPTFYPRRRPSENEVDTRRALSDLIPHLRGCEASHPAFFSWEGCRYYITVTPEKTPDFPSDLRIDFADGIETP